MTGKIETATCAHCGKTFTTRARRPSKFCSHVCAAHFYNPAPALHTCLHCGKEFKPFAGAPGKFCSRKCFHESRRVAPENPAVGTGREGGRSKQNYYPQVTLDGKPRALHRVIAEQTLGRPLLPEEVVHHIDENEFNFAPENLLVMSRSEHARLHKDLRGKWSERYDQCTECGTTAQRHKGHGLCETCYMREHSRMRREASRK